MVKKGTWFFDPDGYTRYPLYHGTNSYLLPSIQQHGLGGRDIITEWRALDLYREIAVLTKHDINDPTLRQDGSYRHGEVYLGAYEGRARGYTGELFGLIEYGLNFLPRSIREELLRRYPEIAVLFHADRWSIVLRLPRLHLADLCGWTSDDPCDRSSIGYRNEYLMTLASYRGTGIGFYAPTPTFRLRRMTRDFEVV